MEEIIKLSHAVGAKVLLDACQSVPHMPVDVQALDADWLVASGHKVRTRGSAECDGKVLRLIDEVESKCLGRVSNHEIRLVSYGVPVLWVLC